MTLSTGSPDIGRTIELCCNPERQGIWQLDERIHILHCCAPSSQTGRAHEADKETENEQSGIVVDQGQWDAQNDEQAECYHVRHISTEQGNL